MDKNSKGFVLIFLLIVIVLAGIAGVGYFAFKDGQIQTKPTLKTDVSSPTPSQAEMTYPNDKTSNWSTYSNNQYKFLFKYPPNWSLLPKPDEGKIASFVESKSNKELFITHHQFSASLEVLVNTLQLGEIVGTKTFGNNLFLIINGGLQLPSREYLIEYGNNNVIRFVLEPVEDTTAADEIFSQILSTFEFFGQVTSTPSISPLPSGWKLNTFKNQDIKLNLPGDWIATIEDFPEIPSSLIRMKKSDWNTVPVQLDIKANWDNIGYADGRSNNYMVGGKYPAIRIDPPPKEVNLERYQTNVYFEVKGKVYAFTCIHNWEEVTFKTCNQILQNIKFND